MKITIENGATKNITAEEIFGFGFNILAALNNTNIVNITIENNRISLVATNTGKALIIVSGENIAVCSTVNMFIEVTEAGQGE